MPLDPKVRELLNIMSSMSNINENDPFKFRKERNEVFIKLFNKNKVELREVKDIEINTRDGALKARVYMPFESRNPLPVTVYFHGGGFVYGNRDTHDSVCRLISRLSGSILVSVDYRLAPENKFPKAVYDAYDSVKWVSNNADKLNGDNNRIFLAGDSAGGNLCSAVSLISRDNKEELVKYQVMIYPVVNFKDSSPSMFEFSEGYFLTRERMNWYNKQYFESEEDCFNPLASTINADLRGLPETLVITAEYDPLRDQGETFAHLLKLNGVKASSIRYNGVIHGFVSFHDYLYAGKEAIANISGSVRAKGEH